MCRGPSRHTANMMSGLERNDLKGTDVMVGFTSKVETREKLQM